MIVKILKASAKFSGVRYNTAKAEKGKGELMKVSGFGPLQAYSQLKPEDYVAYLEMVSARNKRIRLPQFHAVISAKGQSSSREELTGTAVKWLKEIGYSKQPYLIMFHKDTKNQHVHIVSTRVDKAGKKIGSAYEKIRAVANLNKVISQDENLQAKADATKAMAYNFSTVAQFMLILESQGYVVRKHQDKLELIKYGHRLLDIALPEVQERIAGSVTDTKRALQLTAFLQKFRRQHAAFLREETTPLPGGMEKGNAAYTSDLAVFMKQKFGIQLIFHGKPGKPAYGYTVIDHSEGNVYKGGEILDLAELIADTGLPQQPPVRPELTANLPPVLHEIIGGEPPLTLSGPLSPASTFTPYQAPIQINISDDIDDEAIHGRNRRRKKQARTNTR